jgi:hypothetical protein
MSWRQKTMTGVEDCEKFGVVVKQTLCTSEGFLAFGMCPGFVMPAGAFGVLTGTRN